MHGRTQPESAESINGIGGIPTDDDDSQDEASGPALANANGSANGLSARSTSSALNERSSRSPAPPISVPARNAPAKHQQHHHHHRDATAASSRSVSGASSTTTAGGGPGTSPHAGTAKETFLNYFFGQNGPGPLSGPSAERAGGLGAPTGRDVSGADPALESGLMAGKRGGMDRGNAAYDMKSLGRHIEAVSVRSPVILGGGY